MKPRSKHRTPRTEAKMRQVLAVIARIGRKAFPKQNTLAEYCEITKATLVRIISELKREGLLWVERRGPTSAVYHLCKKAVDFLCNKPEMANSLANSLANSSPAGPISDLKADCNGLLLGSPASAPTVEMPEPTITNEYGRRIENPVWTYLQNLLRRRRPAIERARNPEAYAQAILRREMEAAARKPPAREIRGSGITFHVELG